MSLSNRKMRRIAGRARKDVRALLTSRNAPPEVAALVPKEMQDEIASLPQERVDELASMAGLILSDRVMTKGIKARFNEIRPADYEAPALDIGSLDDAASAILADQMIGLPFENLTKLKSRRRRGRGRKRPK